MNHPRREPVKTKHKDRQEKQFDSPGGLGGEI
jgi:hypothetical protein